MMLMKSRHMFNVLLKLPNRGRILGFDVGEKYVGIAVSDESYRLASPLRVMNREETHRKKKDVAEDVSELVTHYSISGIVAGWPTHHGKSTSGTVHVQSFIDDLCGKDKLNHMLYTKWDESYTSKNVELLIKGLGFPPEVDKAIRDKFAAVGILQNYLDTMNIDEVTGKPIIR